MVSCKLNEQEPRHHFAEFSKSVEMPSGIRSKWKVGEVMNMGFANAGKTHKEILDYRLTRFACYLIVMNGDPSKEAIAYGQMYFAVKTTMPEKLPTPTKSILQLQKEKVKAIHSILSKK